MAIDSIDYEYNKYLDHIKFCRCANIACTESDFCDHFINIKKKEYDLTDIEQTCRKYLMCIEYLMKIKN